MTTDAEWEHLKQWEDEVYEDAKAFHTIEATVGAMARLDAINEFDPDLYLPPQEGEK